MALRDELLIKPPTCWGICWTLSSKQADYRATSGVLQTLEIIRHASRRWWAIITRTRTQVQLWLHWRFSGVRSGSDSCCEECVRGVRMLLELQWNYSGCMNLCVLGTVSHKHWQTGRVHLCLLTLMNSLSHSTISRTWNIWGSERRVARLICNDARAPVKHHLINPCLTMDITVNWSGWESFSLIVFQ